MNLNNIKTAWVDFDGTLVDSLECWVTAYKKLCTRRNIQISQDIVHAFDCIRFTEWIKIISQQINAEYTNTLDNLYQLVQLEYNLRVPKNAVLSLLQSLPKNCKKEIVTRESDRIVSKWLKFHNITIFDTIRENTEDRQNAAFYSEPDLMLIDDNINHCIAAKTARVFVVGVNDHHNDFQRERMKAVCDIYIND